MICLASGSYNQSFSFGRKNCVYTKEVVEEIPYWKILLIKDIDKLFAIAKEECNKLLNTFFHKLNIKDRIESLMFDNMTDKYVEIILELKKLAQYRKVFKKFCKLVKNNNPIFIQEISNPDRWDLNISLNSSNLYISNAHKDLNIEIQRFTEKVKDQINNFSWMIKQLKDKKSFRETIQLDIEENEFQFIGSTNSFTSLVMEIVSEKEVPPIGIKKEELVIEITSKNESKCESNNVKKKTYENKAIHLLN